MTRYHLIFGMLAFMAGGTLTASAQGINGIRIQNGWARTSATDKSTANIYLEIENQEQTSDELVSVWTSIAESAVVMQPHWQGLKMSLERAHSILLAPGNSLIMRPGAYQITVSGLSHPIHPGQTIPLELHFHHAGRLEYSVKVSNRLIVSKKRN